MRQRERERDAAAERIREYGYKVTRDAIDRYLLWTEQNENCVYSGAQIGVPQLLSGEVDIDHILPRGRSLDNSQMNKVVAFRTENAQKGDRTPYEWLAKSNPEKYEQVLQRARRLPYPKLRRFYQESVELEDFFARQLVDTTYITTQVHQYVRCLGADVLCIRGQHTAELRRHWGLNTVLRHDLLDLKNRDDHRHHAVDAIVIVLTSRSRLQQLARIYREGGTETTGEILPEPWEDFRGDVDRAVNGVHVSHRVRRKVAGALHKDTIYGRAGDSGKFVHRKLLEELTPPMVPQIRDRVVRELVTQRLREHGIEPGRGGGKIPAETWTDPLWLNREKRVPIRRVRLVIPSESIRPIRDGRAYVQPGNTHHICCFETADAQGQPTLEPVFVSMLDAAERVKRREPLVQRVHPTNPDARFAFSLAGNEMLMLTHDGVEDLYRFDTAASTSGQMWFRHHTFAGRSTDKSGRISKKPSTLCACNPRKVTVDPLGRIRWAND
jgi:CRISPR-associated endonuclease Csn1